MADAAVSSDLEHGRILTGLARGRFGRIAPERIARHVLQSQANADWSVLKASFDALARRYGFAQRDALQVAERPSDSVFGSYRTSGQQRAPKAASSHTRPYETALYQIDPLITSCSCPDFVRSSLGLCKHGLVVLELLEQRGELKNAAQTAKPTPELRWNYAQPLPGPFDRLLRLECGTAAASGSATKYFQNTKLDQAALAGLPARAELLTDLERALSSGELRAEPAVQTLLAEERTRAELQRALQPQLERALASLEQCKRQLYPYQREGVQRFLERGRLLLADDMGLGKTTQAIAASHALLSVGSATRVLLIVPTPLKSQWKREWESTTDVAIWLVEGSPKERKRLYRTTRRGALVLGYEQLLRDLEHVQSFAPELVVLDEAQRIKNWATKSAAYVKSLAPAYRLVLTGTPMENRFDELASIMDFVDDLALEPKWRLVPYHTVTQPGDKVDKVIAGARNLEVLRTRLSSAMLRRTRSSVLSQLPARTDTRIPVEMTEVQRAAHDELRQPIAELSARAERRALGSGELMRLMQLLTTQRMICNGMAQLRFDVEWPRCESQKATPALLDSLFAPKLSVLRGLIEQVVIEQRRKVVVFSQWRKLLCFAEWAVRDVLAEAGMRALFFTGAESLRAREQAIVDLHEDPNAVVLFSSDAGATGLNLQRAASCCINLELPWNPAVLEQRIARVHRLGQTQPIDVYNLVTEDGIEGRIAKLLEQKQALFSSLFDGTSDEVAFEGQTGFVDSVKQLLDPMPAGFVTAAGSDLEPDTSELAPLPAAADDNAPAPAEPPSLEALGIGLTRKKNGRLQIEVPEALSARVDEWLPLLAERLRNDSRS
ncbi:MAG TPA: DEAD/DEAH box helicase [Polyangiales bacterium]|nr:DEAD/DEAH box helicase [Polyangiales bacterium]